MWGIARRTQPWRTVLQKKPSWFVMIKYSHWYMTFAETEQKHPQKDEFCMTARGRENSHSLLINTDCFLWANAGSGNHERMREGNQSQGVVGSRVLSCMAGTWRQSSWKHACSSPAFRHKSAGPELAKSSILWAQFITRGYYMVRATLAFCMFF